jgi:hypothetical protein
MEATSFFDGNVKYIYEVLKATLYVFRMWPCKLKVDEEKSKHVGLAQTIGWG